MLVFASCLLILYDDVCWKGSNAFSAALFWSIVCFWVLRLIDAPVAVSIIMFEGLF
jgi:hypothetical protein